MTLFRIKEKSFHISIYVVPTCSCQGLIAAWKSKYSQWRSGFVVRILWFGTVINWGKV